MFTGLVHESARVTSASKQGLGLRLSVAVSANEVARSQMPGASIALNGACMTSLYAPKAILGSNGSQNLEFSFDVSPESLALTNLGQLKPGQKVHIEYPLRVGQELGGHMVSGHIDGQGLLKGSQAQGDYWSMSIAVTGQAYQRIAPYLVEKGSIAVDGVSLTVNKVIDHLGDAQPSTVFELLLVPHTLKVTFFKDLEPGSSVNLEADLMAKYAARLSTFKKGL
jgi:riboflavin synthase